MPKTMVIKAKNGLRIPRPESSYRYVEGDEPVEVDVSTFDKLTYWTRRIDHGEAEQLDEAAAKTHREEMAARRAEEEAAEKKAIEDLAAKQAASAAAPEAPEAPVVQTPATTPPPTSSGVPELVHGSPAPETPASSPPDAAATDTKAEEK